ncbi:MAG: Rieske (2Fe-2S) protein, partial [Rhodoferax sp.]
QDPVHWSSLANAPAEGTPVARLCDLADAQATMLALDAQVGNNPPFRLLLLRDGPKVHGFVNRCPHFGVPLAARQEQLIQTPLVSMSCNVHYARFRWRDGFCETGDCEGESLLSVPLVLQADGWICIGAMTLPGNPPPSLR